MPAEGVSCTAKLRLQDKPIAQLGESRAQVTVDVHAAARDVIVVCIGD